MIQNSLFNKTALAPAYSFDQRVFMLLVAIANLLNFMISLNGGDSILTV